MDNNNKRPNDGRRSNKRKARVKVIPDKNLPAPIDNKAKKDRAKKLSSKAINNIFGSEDGIWDKLAEMAMEGNMKAMEKLMEYQYGKSGERKEERQATTKAPIIQFNVPQPKDDTLDITHEEE